MPALERDASMPAVTRRGVVRAFILALDGPGCGRLGRRCQDDNAPDGRRLVWYMTVARYYSRAHEASRKHADQTKQEPGNLSESPARTRLPDHVRVPRVHVPLPAHRTARLRAHPD